MRLLDSSPMRGLIVERNDAVRRFLAAALTEAGYAVRSEPTGLLGVAVASVNASPIDFLVAEEDLGEVTGAGLAKMVRLLNPKARILLLAHAHGTPAPRRSVDAVLAKPFTATALWNAVASMLQTRAPRRCRRARTERTKPCSRLSEALR